MPFIKDSVKIEYNEVILKHEFNESYRMELALFHYYRSHKCKNDICKLYDVNRNTFNYKWSKSKYPKKSKNGIYLNPLYSNFNTLNTKMELN